MQPSLGEAVRHHHTLIQEPPLQLPPVWIAELSIYLELLSLGWTS